MLVLSSKNEEKYSICYLEFICRIFLILFFYVPLKAHCPVNPSHNPSPITPRLLLWAGGSQMGILPPLQFQSLQGQGLPLPPRPEKAAQLEEHIPHKGKSCWNNPHSNCSEQGDQAAYLLHIFREAYVQLMCVICLVVPTL